MPDTALIAAYCGAGAAALAALALLIFGCRACLRRVQYIGKYEQLRVKRLTTVVVTNGPAVAFPSLFTTLSYTKRKATKLVEGEYCLVRDDSTGARRVVKGPAVVFLGAYETAGDVQHSRMLRDTDAVHVSDTKTGAVRLVKGPAQFSPGPNETVVKTSEAVSLSKDQFVVVRDKTTGASRVEAGEQSLFLNPQEQQVGPVRKGYTLAKHRFVRLQDTVTGDVRVVRGEALVIPGPFEIPMDGGPRDAIDLKGWEYSVVIDESTAVRRTERGPALVFLGPADRVVDDSRGSEKQDAVRVDTENAALVRQRTTGEQRLVTEPGLLFPTEDEEVVEVRPRISLADHEAIVLKDAQGKYQYHYGAPDKPGERTLFVPPHWDILTLCWSRGRKRTKRDLRITKLDMRPQYMSFEFSCRTADNVEMILEGTFFWEVVSLPDMLQFTGDAPGDVCSHARSCFIGLVSKVTLSEFMATFNEIAKAAHSNDDHFYSKRGLKIHSLEVTRYACADVSTASILEQIIMETTNRMNRLSKQESENEVAVARLKGEVELELATTELLDTKAAHAIASATAEGAADAARVVAFHRAVREAKTDADAKECWHTLRKGESIEQVAQGNAHVYFTPAEANLTFEHRGEGGRS